MKYSKNFHPLFAKSKNINKSFVFILLIGTAFSQAFAQYEIKKYSINSGGTTVSGGGFELQSSTGQIDANAQLTGGNFSLNSGFWQENKDLIFKNNLDGTGE